MAHVAKYAASASGHLAAHYERRKDDKGEYIKFGNQDIDTSRSHLNYNMAPEREGGQLAFLRQRTTEARTLKRDDVKVMCSWVVTLPTYQWHDPSKHVSMDPEKVEKLFFERTYQFLQERYGGEKNVISAWVHRDEHRSHMHFAFVPVTPDPKKGGEKVSAKDVLTREDLRTFHADLERHLDSFHDWHFEVVNEATKDGNKTIAELKKATAHQEVLQAQQQATEARQQLQRVQEETAEAKRTKERLDAQKRGLEGDIAALESVKDTMTAAELKEIQADTTIFGGLKGVTRKQWEATVRTAEKVDTLTAERDEAVARAAVAEQISANAYADANRQLRELRAQDAQQLADAKAAARQEFHDQTSSMKWRLDRLERENRQLTGKINRLEKAVEYLQGIIQQRVPELIQTVQGKVKQLLTPGQGRDH